MDALISTVIVMIPLLLVFFWGRWSGMKTVMNQIEIELGKE